MVCCEPNCPTAQGAVVGVAWTALRLLLAPGAGLAIIDHLCPFQGISMAVSSPTKTARAKPTAQALVGDRVVTDSRVLLRFLRDGAGTRVHDLPFQCRVSDRPFLSPPTSHPFRGELKPMPLKSPLVRLAALDQWCPFQCRSRAVEELVLLLTWSATQTEFAAVAATLISVLFCVP